MSKTYYEQFRNNQNGYNAKNSSKIRQQQPPPRPTAIKQSPRSDTFVVSNKQNERSPKFAKMNGTRQAPLPQLSDKKRSESLQRKPPPRPAQKLLSPSSDQIDYERKPVRFAQRANSRLPPANPQRPAPYTSDISNQPRRVRVSNDDYVIQRHRGPPTEYVYEDDYRSVSSFILTVIALLISMSYHESYYYSSGQKKTFSFFIFNFESKEKEKTIIPFFLFLVHCWL